jgi:hypothetical protein
MATNVEAGVKKRMRLNCQCINQIRVSGTVRLAKMRHALDGCAPFRPHGDCDGRLRREHFPSPRPTQNNRPAFILAEQTGLKTNPSKHVGLDRSLLSKGELQPKLYVAGPTIGLPAWTSGVEHPQPKIPGALGSSCPPLPGAEPYGLAKTG